MNLGRFSHARNAFRRHPGRCCLLALFVLPLSVGADETIDEIIVVESRIDDDAYRIGTQISVDSAEIEAVKPADVEQLLGRLPGVSVNRPGGPGGVSAEPP